MTPKWRFFAGLTTLLVTLCIAWQYCVYKEDQRRFDRESYMLQKAYASVEKAHFSTEKIKKIDTSTENLSEKIPIGDYQNEHFLKSLRTLCLLNGTTYLLLNKKFKAQPFYSLEQLTFKIYGMKTSVLKVLSEIEQMNRLINWKTICIGQPSPHTKRVEIRFSIKIYHLNPIKLRRKKYIKMPDLEIQTWLPPFTSQLTKIKEDAQTTYDLLKITPNAENLLHLVEEYKWKKARLLQLQSIKKQLEDTRTPLASLLENLSPCPPK